MSANAPPIQAIEERKRPMTREEKRVILASSAGTIFEWYDFYLYGSLAAIIGAQFFSSFPEATRNVFALLANGQWYTLPAHVENGYLQGTAAAGLEGNAGPNLLG